MPAGRDYSVSYSIATVTTAKTLVQIKAGASTPLQIIRFRIGGNANTSNAGLWAAGFLSAACTVTSYTPAPLVQSAGTVQIAQAAGGVSATGTNSSAEGTYAGGGTSFEQQGDFNAQSGGGYEYFWVPGMEEIWVKAGGIWGLKLNSTITSATLDGFVVFREVG